MVSLGARGILLVVLAAWCLAIPALAAEPRPVAIWVPGAADNLPARQIAFLTKRIEERLPGHFAFEVQSGSICPPEAQLLDQIRSDRIDIAVMGDALIDDVPRLSLFRLPWLFVDRDHVQRALYAGLEDEIRTHVESTLKLIVVGLYENGFRQIRADKAILGPEDLMQRKILVNEGRKMRDLLRSFGAIPQKYPPEAAAEALERGIVDSFDGRLDTLVHLPIGDKAPVITLTRHVYEPTFVVASRKFWESLTNGERAALTEIGVDFSDTAAQLAVTYWSTLSKHMPRKIRLQAMSPDRFTAVSNHHRAAYERAYGTDWLDFVDLTREGEAVPTR